MVTQDEETQAKEFLKRAEIKTMKKDLLALREVDSLKERDKIAHIKTLEEQQAEQQKKLQEKESLEKFAREDVLQKNERQETIAEKDLKNYATEQERQQMFLLESQRLGFEKQIDEIDQKKDPELKIEKNKLLLQKRDWQTKLNTILEQEKKFEDEQGFLGQKAQETTIPAERKGLEERRWDIDKEIQNIEKNRWEVEKQIESIDNKAKEIDKSSENLVTEKNGLRDKVLGIDKSLREVYSVVIAREEEKRSGQAQDQIAKREALAKLREEKNEKVQRQQWGPTAAKQQVKDEGYLSKAPKAVKERLTKTSETEEQQRTKFLHDVEDWSKEKGTDQQQQNSAATTAAPSPQPKNELTPPIPPVPHKK